MTTNKPDSVNLESTIARALEQAAARQTSAAVLQSIAELQNKLFPNVEPGPKWQAHFQALSSGNCATVVTGQQVGLFLGPLYTLYKAATAIKAALHLQRTSGIAVVPVFWLQSEDHDLEEISSATILNRSGELKLLTLSQQALDNRSSVGSYKLDISASDLLGQLDREFSDLPGAAQLLATVKQCYRPGNSISDAFAKLLGYFTAEHGLIFLDPRCPLLRDQSKNTYRIAWEKRELIESLLTKETEALQRDGVPTVFVRPNSPLFFYHPQAEDGPRYRLEQQQENWQLVGAEAEITTEQLAHAIESKPENFSTSALLRPLLQENFLPTAVYIGGPAEIAYWKQIRPLFPLFAATLPLVLPRADILLVEKKAANLLQQLNLSSSQLLLPREKLLALIQDRSSLAESASHLPIGPAALAAVSTALESLRSPFSQVDKTLISALDKSSAKVVHQVSSLIARYERAKLLSDKTTLDRLIKLANMLSPNGQEQQRVHCSISYLLRYPDQLFGRIIAETELFAEQLKTIYLD